MCVCVCVCVCVCARACVFVCVCVIKSWGEIRTFGECLGLNMSSEREREREGRTKSARLVKLPHQALVSHDERNIKLAGNAQIFSHQSCA